MWQTPLISILAVLVASMLGAAGQYLIKTGTERTGGGWALLTSPWVWAGMASYLAVMFFFTYAFKRGGTVTVLYPIYATTFIWAAFMGWMIYGQAIKPIHVLGMGLLIVGMYCMGSGNAALTTDASAPPAADTSDGR